ncbi:unnamed protein product [Alopecurus aequalis]
MCFEFGSCFGNSIREDYGGEPSDLKPARGGRRRADHRKGYYSGTDDRQVQAPPANNYQPHATAIIDEAGHKAYHDGARKDHHAAAVAGDHGGYAAYGQDKAEYDTTKLPAWHNKVGDDAGYNYTARQHEAAADRRENAAMSYHHYPTAANTTLGR